MKLIYSLTMVTALSMTIFACGGKENKTDAGKAPEVQTVNMDGLKIAFYNSDTMATKYNYLRQQDSILKIRQAKYEAELTKRQRTLEDLARRMEDHQRNMTATGMELQKMQESFQQKQQEAQMYQQNEGVKLQNEAGEIQTVIAKRIEAASKKYCEKYKIDLLLVHGQGGQIAYIKPKMDVSESFADFINSEQALINKDMGK